MTGAVSPFWPLALKDYSALVAKGLSNHRAPLLQSSGGRTWWAHFEFTRINIAPTILPKKIEDLHEARPVNVPR